MTRKLALLALCALGACNPLDKGVDVGAGSHASAQAVNPNARSIVWTVDGGVCTGNATTTNPVDCVLHTDGVTMSGNSTGASPLSAATVILNSGYFGAGTDQVCDFDGSSVVLGWTPVSSVYTMDRAIYCTVVKVRSGVAVEAQYPIRASDHMELAGTIRYNGNDAVGAVAGAVRTGGITGAPLPGGAAGATGGTGVGPAGTNSTACHPSQIISAAGAGGAGVSAGGNGGVRTNQACNQGRDFQTMRAAVYARTERSIAVGVNLGAGGGAGGGNGTNKGGGGGSGAGYLVVLAPYFCDVGSTSSAPTGTLQAKGGNGGNGETGATATGGGGGGTGGFIVYVYARSTPGLPSTDVSGGTKGTHGSGGGTDGNNGGTGYVAPYLVGLQ